MRSSRDLFRLQSRWDTKSSQLIRRRDAARKPLWRCSLQDMSPTNPKSSLTNFRRISAIDGFSSVQLKTCRACYNRSLGCAGTSVLEDLVRPMNTKLLHSVNQRCSLHSQPRSCATDDPAARLQRTKDMFPLNLRETVHRGIEFTARLERLQFGDRRAQYRMRREDYRAFNEVLQFPDVAGPLVSDQCIHRLGRDYVNSFIHALRVEFREVPHQSRNV